MIDGMRAVSSAWHEARRLTRFAGELRYAFADVDVVCGVGALQEDGPEIVEGIAGDHGEDAFFFQAAGGGEHLQLKREENAADLMQAAGEVGVFAVEGEREVYEIGSEGWGFGVGGGFLFSFEF